MPREDASRIRAELEIRVAACQSHRPQRQGILAATDRQRGGMTGEGVCETYIGLVLGFATAGASARVARAPSEHPEQFGATLDIFEETDVSAQCLGRPSPR